MRPTIAEDLPGKKMGLLSVCLIVKDERDQLASWFESIRELADEVVICDTGSKDGTIEIASALPCRFRSISWNNDFSAARNESIKYATSKWILCLDADERIIVRDRKSFRQSLKRFDALAYELEVRSELERGLFSSEYVIRLFRNLPEIVFQRRVYENVSASVKQLIGSKSRRSVQLMTSAHLEHKGYLPEIYARRRKRERNLQLLKMQISDEPENTQLRWKYEQMMARGPSIQLWPTPEDPR
jgi:Glycosyl transferase family 2